MTLATGFGRAEIALRALTGAALLVAVGALVWPVSVPADQIAPAGLDVGPGGASPAREDPGWARAIVAGNVFAQSRRAPAQRYRPGAAAGADEGAASGSGEGSGRSDVPRLYGIVPTAGGAAALLRLDPAVAGARLYHEGDREGSYRVEAIGEESVVLSGPGGRVVLRLRKPGGASR